MLCQEMASSTMCPDQQAIYSALETDVIAIC